MTNILNLVAIFVFHTDVKACLISTGTMLLLMEIFGSIIITAELTELAEPPRSQYAGTAVCFYS